jgi:hypothetical protein
MDLEADILLREFGDNAIKIDIDLASRSIFVTTTERSTA